MTADSAGADFDDGVLSSLHELCFARPNVETAGALVGHFGVSATQSVVRAIVPVVESPAVGYAVPFSHHAKAVLYQAMASHYPGLDLVGFYVSRPGGSGELTSQDAATFARDFADPRQFALLLDPRSHRGRLYAWRDGAVELLHEGPIARRYTRPSMQIAQSSADPPVAAIVVLITTGASLGALAYLITGGV